MWPVNFYEAEEDDQGLKPSIPHLEEQVMGNTTNCYILAGPLEPRLGLRAKSSCREMRSAASQASGRRPI